MIPYKIVRSKHGRWGVLVGNNRRALIQPITVRKGNKKITNYRQLLRKYDHAYISDLREGEVIVIDPRLDGYTEYKSGNMFESNLRWWLRHYLPDDCVIQNESVNYKKLTDWLHLL